MQLPNEQEVRLLLR